MNIHNLRWIHGIILLALLLLLFPASVLADSELPEVQAGSYIMMEFESGVVLAEEHADVPLSPASMTKMMTEYIVLEKIKEGKIGWADMVTISPHAASLGGAQVYLKEGEKRTVEELFAAMAIHSANDATVALAEHVAKDEASFVQMMNDKVEAFGMTNTHFINSTGLSSESYDNPPQIDGNHVMSARDSALLARRLLLDFPEVIDTTAASVYTFRPGESGQMRLINTNWMLPGLEYAYEGTDGFKTGYTKEAGYCFTGTVERDGMRLITVVMKSETTGRRFEETIKLMDYGYEQYKLMELIAAGKRVPGYKAAPVVDGVETEVGLTTVKPIRLPLLKEEKKEAYSYRVTLENELQAPLKKGTVVGTAEILYNGETVPGADPIPLAIDADVEKGSWLRLAFRDTNTWLASTLGYGGWPLLGQQVLSTILLLVVLVGGLFLVLLVLRKKGAQKRVQWGTVPPLHQEPADSAVSETVATATEPPIRVSLEKEPLPEPSETKQGEGKKALFLGELKTEEDLRKELEYLALQPENSTELTPSSIEGVEETEASSQKEVVKESQEMTEPEAKEMNEKVIDIEPGKEPISLESTSDSPPEATKPEKALDKEKRLEVKSAEKGLSKDQEEAETSDSDPARSETEEIKDVDQSKEVSPSVESSTEEEQESSPADKKEESLLKDTIGESEQTAEVEKNHVNNGEEPVKQQNEKGKLTWVVKQPDGIQEEKEEPDTNPKEEN